MKEKKGILEKIKEKLPGYHPKTEEEKEKEKESGAHWIETRFFCWLEMIVVCAFFSLTALWFSFVFLDAYFTLLLRRFPIFSFFFITLFEKKKK